MQAVQACGDALAVPAWETKDRHAQAALRLLCVPGLGDQGAALNWFEAVAPRVVALRLPGDQPAFLVLGDGVEHGVALAELHPDPERGPEAELFGATGVGTGDGAGAVDKRVLARICDDIEDLLAGGGDELFDADKKP